MINQNLINSKKGFTLLELLIVIAILAVLATIVVLVLNPGETLAKSRDTQRMSDLATIKSAISLYLTTVSSPTLGASGANTSCKSGAGAGSWAAGDNIHYSYSSDAPGAAITDATLDGGVGSAPAAAQVTNANLALTSGSGWIPVVMDNITGGSPISNLPIDPINTVTSVSAVTASDLVYRYACYSQGGTLAFELNANLESTAYTTTGTNDNKEERDGGNNSALHEVGTKLNILGTGSDF